MGNAKQTAIPGALTPLETKAERVAELRGELEDQKIRYEKAADDLFATMLQDGVERVWAQGVIFSVDPGQPKLKIKKGTE